jgi:hypothetical protein
LSAAFDHPVVTELRAFRSGDGEAMSGILIAGRRRADGETRSLVFLVGTEPRLRGPPGSGMDDPLAFPASGPPGFRAGIGRLALSGNRLHP